MVHCAGCNHEFTVSGYTSHIHRTTRVPCRAIHHNELANPALDSDDDDEGRSQAGDSFDSDAERQGFARDLFGDYNDIDVGWPDEEELSEEDNDNNDEEEESGEDEQTIMCSHTCVKRWFWPVIDSTLCIQYYI